ncbi:DUF2586 family protein [Polyangium aurulentum]|uniref:DUF2586 family protein n=1 Tax=Polyangium aurulentum TaxID=2567896 RepID=UPI0010AE49DB|nr:DUF2586 family protein [Polyangium aurulentum]UQA57071.1 hypothetical protein E8A73_038140 [Polyangium aurulentum]
MPSAQINFVEFGSAAPPASAARVVAKVGICSKGSPNTVYAFDVSGPVAGTLGEGPLSEATAQAVRLSKQRTLALPLAATSPGVLGPLQQQGSGPKILVSGEPRDSAQVAVRVTKGGPLGVGRFRVSISSTAAGAQITPLYRRELALPVRRQAEVSGTRNVATLAYAEPATVTGTADLSAAGLYGAGGSLDQKDIVAKIKGGAALSCTLAAPADSAALLSQLKAAFAGTVFALSPTGRLVWTTNALGEEATIEITGGTGLALLGLAVGLVRGKAGELDGKTLTLREDTGAEQTIEFSPPPANPAAVVALVSAASNITASLVAPASKLKIVSDTIGKGSVLSITGGSACELLGLPVVSVEGGEATYTIPGLGVTIEFPVGSYVKDTVYSFLTDAPAFSIEAVLASVDKLVKVGASFRILHVVGELADAAETRALAELRSLRAEGVACGLFDSHPLRTMF